MKITVKWSEMVCYPYTEQYEQTFDDIEKAKKFVAEIEADSETDLDAVINEDDVRIYDEGEWYSDEEIEAERLRVKEFMDAFLAQCKADREAEERAEKERLDTYGDDLDKENIRIITEIMGSEMNVQRVENALRRAGYSTYRDEYRETIVEVGDRGYCISFLPRGVYRDY